jgi:rubrerythrin
MAEQDINLLDAIKIAMEAERKAADFYADTAEKANLLGRQLLKQLAEFERHHYDILVKVEASLRAEGAFTEYEGKELTVPAPSEIQTTEEPNKASLMGIITMALDIEKQAKERYLSLAELTSDQRGTAMFKRLAEEEQMHYVILTDAYWSLNDHGTWVPPTQ